jgi:hypothetical protein
VGNIAREVSFILQSLQIGAMSFILSHCGIVLLKDRYTLSSGK